MDGFTLIEILVVVLLIGILYSLAVFTLGDRQYTETRDNARRLHATLRLAMDEAVIRGRPLALSARAGEYAFLALDDAGDWQRLGDDRGLGRHALAPVVRLELLDSEVPDALLAAQADGDETPEDAPQPRAVFLPTGELTPFRLRLHADNERPDWLIEGSDDGEITLSRRD